MPTTTVDTPEAGSATITAQTATPAPRPPAPGVVLVEDPELFRGAALVLAAYVDGRKPRHDHTRYGYGTWCVPCWLAVFVQQVGLDDPQRTILTTTLPPRPDLTPDPASGVMPAASPRPAGVTRSR